MFHFKQFSIDQTGCAMKVNTDGVLLGALAGSPNPGRILDIGSGTGVIALMLAQRFPEAQVEAIEIDAAAAAASKANFEQSPFADRLRLYHADFRTTIPGLQTLQNAEAKFDLIVSNPPFYTHSLHSPQQRKTLAKHADEDFFKELVTYCSVHMTATGQCWFILPAESGDVFTSLCMIHRLYLQRKINIKSFPSASPHRMILAFSQQDNMAGIAELTIYKAPKIYSEEYRHLLKDFLTIF